jgi:hypothetical protein
MGLFMPLLLTRSVSQYPGLLVYSIPAGLILVYGFSRILHRIIAQRASNSSTAYENSRAVLSPLVLLNFSAAVFIIPVPAIPFFIGAIVLGLVAYQAATVFKRYGICSIPQLEYAIFGLFFTACFLVFFQTSIIHDAFQYLAMLVSVVKDFDLNFFNELYLENAYRFYNPAALHSARYLGVPLLEAPFFAAGELLARAMALLGLYHAPNGMTFPYFLAVSFGSTLFGLGSVLLTYLLCREFYSRGVSLLATMGCWLASPLFFFTFCWNGWPHPFNTFFAALFLLYWKRTLKFRTVKDWIGLGSIGGILCLIRPTNAVLALFPAWEIIQFPRSKRTFISTMTGPFLGMLAVILLFSPQLSIWKCISGQWWSGPYQEVGDYFDWLHPHFFGSLFSTAQHGLFAWSPLLLPATLGLLFLVKKDRAFGVLAIVCVIVHIYIYSAWSVWWTGVGFSNRFYIELLPLLVPGLAAVIEKSEQKKYLSREFTVGLLSFCAVWNIFLIGAYRINSVPYGIFEPARVIDKPLSIYGLISQQLFVIPELVSTLFTAQWSNDNFFADRLIYAVLLKKPVATAAVLAVMGLLAAVVYGMIRLVLRPDAGARLRGALTVLLCGAAGTVVVTHIVILGAYKNTIPFGHIYNIDAIDVLVRRPAEDAWFQSSYAYPVIKIDLISHLIYGFTIPQGDAVALVSVYDQDDRQFDYVIRAGIDTAEYSYLRPKVINTIQHSIQQATIVREVLTRAYSRSLYAGITCMTQLQLPEPVTVKNIRVRCIEDRAQLIISDFFLRDF